MADGFGSPWEMVGQVSELIRSPNRITVSEAAERSLLIANPGGYRGPWDRLACPYMARPMDMVRSRAVEAVVFVGPAQSLKTFSLLGGAIAHAAVYDPADQLVIQMTQDAARDWSRKELDRWIRSSPDIAAQLSPRPRDDNTYDKFLRNGAIIKIGWPSVTQVSSKSVRDVLITDYDRIPDDIDGEGSIFGLARQRVKAWRSRGIVVVESSPGRALPNELAKWKPIAQHEPPPVGGILGLYGESDRSRWYWPCPHCGEHWEPAPGLGLFRLPEFADLQEVIKKQGVNYVTDHYSRPVCPHCHTAVDQSSKRAMNIAGQWVCAGQQIDRDGVIAGEARKSSIAGFWLGGIAAAMSDWDVLVERYAQAVNAYTKTGEIFLLKDTCGTDQASPFVHPRAAGDQHSIADLQNVAESWDRGTVPDWVRFLIATVDVQVGRFVCQVFGMSPGASGEIEWTIVDRIVIDRSARQNELGERHPVNPAMYREDWELLVGGVMQSKYAQGEAVVSPWITLIDSGGAAGKAGESVTEKAYAFWRSLAQRGMGHRVRLVKGRGDARVRVEETYPDTRRRTNRGASRGDVPLLMLATNALKDAIASDVEKATRGEGGARWPAWLPADVLAELTVEVRTDKGWIKPSGARNEAFDLAVYAKAGAIWAGAERPGWWERAPWAIAPSVKATPARETQATPSSRPRGRQW